MADVKLLLGDCLDVLPTLPANSVDAVVTDPPYGLEFMGKEWDSFRGEAWRAGAGLSKPGIGERQTAWVSFGAGDSANATCAACGGRMRGARKCACESPDWMVKGRPLGERNSRAEQGRAYQRWCEAWAAACLRVLKPGGYGLIFGGTRTFHRLACALEDAGFELRDTLCWLYGQGFPKAKSCLKPGWEPILLVRRPGPRVLPLPGLDACRLPAPNGRQREGESSQENRYTDAGGTNFAAKPGPRGGDPAGRWPANVVLDEEAAAMLDAMSGTLASGDNCVRRREGYFGAGDARNMGLGGPGDAQVAYGDMGGASRFFYCPKATKKDRDEGLDGLPEQAVTRYHEMGSAGEPRAERAAPQRNIHPTVKPTRVMSWLVQLVTPEGGVCLDPFAGSGSTGKACVQTGRRFIGIERDPGYHAIAAKRIAAAQSAAPLFDALEAP